MKTAPSMRRLFCVTQFALVVTAIATRALSADPPADVIAPPKFVAAFGRAGAGDGEFKSPIGLAINAADELFVTDAFGKSLQRFTREGKFLGKVTTGEFPGGIAVDRDGLVYVAAMMDHKISVYRPRRADAPPEAPAFALVREFGSKGNADGQFDQPGGLAFASDGSLLVCDQVNHRVQRLTPEGRFLGKWGEYGDAAGQFGARTNPIAALAGRASGPLTATATFTPPSRRPVAFKNSRAMVAPLQAGEARRP